MRQYCGCLHVDPEADPDPPEGPNGSGLSQPAAFEPEALPPYPLDRNLDGIGRPAVPKVNHTLSFNRCGALRATRGLHLPDLALLLSQLGLQPLNEFCLGGITGHTGPLACQPLSKLGDLSSQAVKLTLGRTSRPLRFRIPKLAARLGQLRPQASSEFVGGRASGPPPPSRGACSPRAGRPITGHPAGGELIADIRNFITVPNIAGYLPGAV